MSRFWIVWAALTAAVLLPGPAPAGIVCLPGRIDDGRYVAGEQDAPLAYSILYSTITADASGGRLTVKVHETIAGPPQRRAVSGLIPLPKQADLGSVVVSAGQPNEPSRRRLAAVALDTTAAQRLYESVARQTGSTRILAWTGRPVLVVPELQLDGETELCCEFTASIAERDGLYGLTCPLPITAWASGPVERLSLAITVRGPQPLRTIFSPTHEVEVSRQGWREAAVRLKQDRWAGDDELRLLWVADRDPLGLRVLAYRAPEDEDGYFMLVGNPTGGEQAEQPLPKDVLFVLDISGSMRGEKLEQARAAIAYCLQQLQPDDRFNIIAFGTQVVSFQDAPAASSERLVAEAAVFLDELVATGRTNIEGALLKTLAGQAGDGRPRMAIFLTDGTPTAGELVPEKIVEQVQQANASNTRIFVLGVGHDVNAHLLDKLAEVTGGSSQYVEPNQEIDAQVAALYDRLAHPVLNDVAVDFGGLRTHSVYPQQLGVLFRGSEIMIAGRYRDGGPHEFSISGTLAGRAIKYGCRVDLPIRPGEAEYEFVAPLWAARKIGYLLQELRLHGQNQELIAEVVRLSKQFGIVTEYTQFLAESGGTFTTEAAVAQARVQLEQANVQQAGQWAVNQAFNDQGLQTRKVAGNAANTYRDRRGNVVGADSVKQIGGRVFYLRDGQWIDGDEAGNRQQRVVKLFSPEYFELLRANADFAPWSRRTAGSRTSNSGSRRFPSPG